MSVTYLEAIRAAQEKALADDPRVFIYGQDVGAFGGAFKATKNLAAEFPGRVMDSPLSEDAIVGLAIGAAIEGARPIVSPAPSLCACPAVARSALVRSTARAWKRSTRIIPGSSS
jgi:pyruvate/2-oxoglutarate/acetoin dehydrogenase E1 component